MTVEQSKGPAQVVITVGLALWIFLALVVAVRFGFVHSWLQAFTARDESYGATCHAVWVGGRLDGLGFSARRYQSDSNSQSAIAATVKVPSLDCYEGRYSDRPLGRHLGVLSESLIAEQLSKALPQLPIEEVGEVSREVLGVLNGVRERGLDAMTFWEFEQGGAIAEGRLRAINAYGAPGEAVGFRFGRILLTWGALVVLGVTIARVLRSYLAAASRRHQSDG